MNDSLGALSENGCYHSFDLKWRGSIETPQYQSSSLHTGSVVLPARTDSKEPSIVWAFIKSFAGKLVAAALFKLAHDLLLFASPQLLKYVTCLAEFIVHHSLSFSLSLSLSLLQVDDKLHNNEQS